MITTKQIAEACGVSRGTVDRALNSKSEISAATRERVLRVAKELGYRPDLLARSLSTGKTMSIGVVTFDVNSRYFSQLVNTIEIEARKHGYLTYITLSEKDPSVEKNLIHQLADRRVDGLIISSILKERTFEQTIKNISTPVVTVGNRVSARLPYIGIDDRKAICDGLVFILGHGYEKVAFLCPPLSRSQKENIYAQRQRAESFLSYFKEYPKEAYALIDSEQYREKIIELAQGRKRTAIFCSSDTYALEVLGILQSIGKSSPADLGIMGIDNIDILKYISPRITSIANPLEEQAKMAVSTLMQMIENKEVPLIQYAPHSIAEGNSILAGAQTPCSL